MYVTRVLSNAFESREEEPATEPQLVSLKGVWLPPQDADKRQTLNSLSSHTLDLQLHTEQFSLGRGGGTTQNQK